MNAYEQMKDAAYTEGIEVIERRFDSSRIKGLYCDGTAAVNASLETSSAKGCVLAEELGHYYTSSGDILDMTSAVNRKQEYKARLWAYNHRIGLHGILSAYKAGCQSTYEIADYLDVIEEFLLEAIACYQNKYGICVEFDNYIIYFVPSLAVFELMPEISSDTRNRTYCLYREGNWEGF